MAEYTYYFIPLAELTVTEGRYDDGLLIDVGTGGIFPSLDIPNYQADNDFGFFSPATLTTSGNSTTMTVIDDDPDLNDEDTNPPVLTGPVAGVPGSAAGQIIELSYSYELTGSDGSTIIIYAIDVETTTPTDYSIDGVVASAPLVPGVTYTVTNVYDGLASQANPPYEQLVPCFTKGTLIETPGGPLPIEILRVGDRVMTEDHGPQEIRWIGERHLCAAALAAQPNLRPIRIRAGALGQGLPYSDLTVSPQHRMLVRSNIARRMFDSHEVLIAAKHLTALPGIDERTDAREVTYLHMLFDRHEVVFANGAASESFYTGAQALKSVDAAALQEILTLFPELRDPDMLPEGARPFVKGKQGRKLAERHVKNGKPLYAA